MRRKFIFWGILLALPIVAILASIGTVAYWTVPAAPFVVQGEPLIAYDPEIGFGCEWIEDHRHTLELFFLLSDDGFAHVVFVPNQSDIDADLLSLCATFAGEQTIS